MKGLKELKIRRSYEKKFLIGIHEYKMEIKEKYEGKIQDCNHF